MRHKWVMTIVVLTCLLLLSSTALAVWMADGTAICTAQDVQEHAYVIQDGTGGAVYVWSDYRNGNWDVYAQRLDRCGNSLWMMDGVPVCTASGHQLHGSVTNWFTTMDFRPIVPDGAGGAIIAWHDGRGGDLDVYIQRVDSDGNVLWPLNGVLIATVAGIDEVYPTLMPDGAGGAFITWTLNRTYGTYQDIYAQRVDANGNAMWAAGGILICNAGRLQWGPELVSDGAGGIIVVWMDYRNIGSDIYGQRVDPSGNVLWTPNGVGIRVAGGVDDGFPAVLADGAGGAIVAFDWQPWGGHPNHDIYAQRVDANGNLLWPAPGGVPIAVLPGSKQRLPGIVTDGAGGAMINWWDNRNGNWDIYAQRIDPSGAAQWAVNGVPVCAAAGLQGYPVIIPGWTKTIDMISDGAGGAILAWHDFRGPNGDIYVQRIDGTGTELWTHDGVAICTAAGDQTAPGIAMDGAGGGIVVWQDERGADSDIYSQRIGPDGTVITCYTLDIKPGSCPNPFNPKDEPDEGGDGKGQKEDYAIDRKTGGVVPAAIVGSEDADVNDIDVSTVLLEGISPVRSNYEDVTRPVENGGECACTDQGPDGYLDLTLKFSRNELSGVLGPLEHGEIVELTITGELMDGTPFEASDCITVVGKRPEGPRIEAIDVAPLGNPVPNPFNPMTRIHYYVPDESVVTLEIFDTSGRLVVRLVDNERMPRGMHAVEWRGVDGHGRAVGSGVYYYRLKIGAETISKKMVLLR